MSVSASRSALVEVNDRNFDREVLASPEPVLLQFLASWCAPCTPSIMSTFRARKLFSSAADRRPPRHVQVHLPRPVHRVGHRLHRLHQVPVALVLLPGDPPARPSFLWITAEDLSPDLGSYGAPEARTPHLDRLAGEGARFQRAFAVAGVCAPSRSASRKC